MRETTELTGVVLQSQPVGEFDRRCVILTREMGKITAFARGARRATSPLLAVTNPFVFASFTLYEGRNAYTLVSADVSEYFTELPNSQPGVYYGFYFLELAAWYGREGIEAGDMVSLIYVALKALMKNKMPARLIRRVFECRTLTLNGEFALPDEGTVDQNLYYALKFSMYAPLPRLFSFTLNENTERLFFRYVDDALKRMTGKKFKSLQILEVMAGLPDA